MTKPVRGIFAIAQTPFDGDNNLLWDDFERECDFIARSGAHGFVWPVMASEFTVISYPERVEGMRAAMPRAASSALKRALSYPRSAISSLAGGSLGSISAAPRWSLAWPSVSSRTTGRP